VEGGGDIASTMPIIFAVDVRCAKPFCCPRVTDTLIKLSTVLVHAAAVSVSTASMTTVSS
jgi:hypothetical protein